MNICDRPTAEQRNELEEVDPHPVDTQAVTASTGAANTGGMRIMILTRRVTCGAALENRSASFTISRLLRPSSGRNHPATCVVNPETVNFLDLRSTDGKI